MLIKGKLFAKLFVFSLLFRGGFDEESLVLFVCFEFFPYEVELKVKKC